MDGPSSGKKKRGPFREVVVIGSSAVVHMDVRNGKV